MGGKFFNLVVLVTINGGGFIFALLTDHDKNAIATGYKSNCDSCNLHQTNKLPTEYYRKPKKTENQKSQRMTGLIINLFLLAFCLASFTSPCLGNFDAVISPTSSTISGHHKLVSSLTFHIKFVLPNYQICYNNNNLLSNNSYKAYNPWNYKLLHV